MIVISAKLVEHCLVWNWPCVRLSGQGRLHHQWREKILSKFELCILWKYLDKREWMLWTQKKSGSNGIRHSQEKWNFARKFVVVLRDAAHARRAHSITERRLIIAQQWLRKQDWSVRLVNLRLTTLGRNRGTSKYNLLMHVCNVCVSHLQCLWLLPEIFLYLSFTGQAVFHYGLQAKWHMH